MSVKLIHGDSLAVIGSMLENSVDAVICDLPFGTTNCKWDSIIPLELMWHHLKRVVKSDGAIVLNCVQPFTTKLISSNYEMFKYCWVWEKSQATGHLNSSKRPMVAHEDIAVFYKKQCVYNPQKTSGHKRKVSLARHKENTKLNQAEIYNEVKGFTDYDSTERFPRSVLRFASDKQKLALHPTQKPLALGRYLVKTYMNKGDTLLDLTCGSGTYLLDGLQEGMNVIGIDNGFCDADRVVNGISLQGMKWVEIAKLRLEGKL
jgi:adenine specific DNA methylase Mod